MCGTRVVLDGVSTTFAGADANRVFHGKNKHLAVTDFSGFGGFDNGLDDLVDAGVVDNHFELHFGEEVHGVLATTVDFGMTFLATEAFDFRDGHAFDAYLGEGFFDVFDFEWFDDGFDFFHGERRLGWMGVVSAALTRGSVDRTMHDVR